MWGKVHSCVLHDLSWHNLGVLSADISWGLLESQLKVPPNCFKQWPVKQYSIAFSADPAKLIYDHKEIQFFTFWLIDFIYSFFSDLFPQQLAPSVSVVTSSPNSPNSPNNQQSFTVETGSDPNNGGGFHLNLLVFLFVYLFCTKMTALVESTFGNPAELFIFITFHNHSKIFWYGILLKTRDIFWYTAK